MVVLKRGLFFDCYDRFVEGMVGKKCLLFYWAIGYWLLCGGFGLYKEIFVLFGRWVDYWNGGYF